MLESALIDCLPKHQSIEGGMIKTILTRPFKNKEHFSSLCEFPYVYQAHFSIMEPRGPQ